MNNLPAWPFVLCGALAIICQYMIGIDLERLPVQAAKSPLVAAYLILFAFGMAIIFKKEKP